MMQPITPSMIVYAMRKNIKNAEVAFTQGKCYQLHLMLKTLYPNAIAWYEPTEGHVYTKINDFYYDIRGTHKEIPATAYLLASEPRILAQAADWDYQ
jgi:hypothetical protein